ncbi:MAG: TerD family protein [Clostridia bacterium]|nr:TerD family protein [Clostridia bacterium]
MMENHENKKVDYRAMVNQLGKKEFTLIKMQEYGFWPKDLPTPYEKQQNETAEQYAYRKSLIKEYEKIINQITDLYKENDEINRKLYQLKKEYDQTWDYEKIRLDIAKRIMEESIARRAERKKQRELEKKQRREAWQQKKAGQILFIGKGYSGQLQDMESDDGKLSSQGLPLIKTDRDLADFLGVDYKALRFLVYHRDVVSMDHYHRYTVPKRKGGLRNIAAPKSTLKAAQKKMLEGMLSKISVSDHAHGFIKGKSVVSGAQEHIPKPQLVINMDLEDFFPTITFERVRGMFKAFGYSGYIASLMAMICTYCERMAIEVRGVTKYVKTSPRILPQGSPASPMVTNILCMKLDKRLNGLASKYGFSYTRYADDMSFSIEDTASIDEGKFCGLVSKIVNEEGFKINKAKTRFLRQNNRQAITGVVINNEQLGVPKKWVKRLRAAIYNANKLKPAGYIPPATRNEISGMAAWLKSVNPERYKDIIAAAMEIIAFENDPAAIPVEPKQPKTVLESAAVNAALCNQDAIILKKGQRLSVKGILGDKIQMVFDCVNQLEPMDIDPYVFLLDHNRKVANDKDVIFFGNPASKCGGVKYSDENEEKTVWIELDKIPHSIQTVSVCYSIYGGDPNHNFSKLVQPSVKIRYEGKEKLHFTPEDLLSERVVVFVEFYRYKDEWKINSVGAGYEAGIKHLCRIYGLEVN